MVKVVDLRRGTVCTLAGSEGQGIADGCGDDALFDHPVGIVGLANGSVAITEHQRGGVRLISATGDVATLAGCGRMPSFAVMNYADGKGPAAKFGRLPSCAPFTQHSHVFA
jgi:hypothetical protein